MSKVYSYSIPYIIILNYKNKNVIYDIINSEFISSSLNEKIVDIMYSLYDNELTSFTDFINRETKLPHVLYDINN